jgi:hypothetical protein
MSKRSKYQGMAAIAQFNWPFYVAAALALLASVSGFLTFSRP